MKEGMSGVLLSNEDEVGDDDCFVEAGTQTITTGSVQTDNHNVSAVFIEKPAIRDLQTVASAFNEAFNVALHEIEYSRKAIEERSTKIDDLNGAISSIRSALDDALYEGRIKEEAHLKEIAQLSQRMQEVESERDKLQERFCEQERILVERVAEISKLSGRVEELNTNLEQQIAERLRAQEEYTSEKDALTVRLKELQDQYNEEEGQLQAQHKVLEDRDVEIAELGRRIDDLLADMKVKNKVSSQLNQQITKLQDEVTKQTESMRQQSESHAAEREELNAVIVRVSTDLETLRVSHAELTTHAEKLENLNKALHESSLTEKKVHKQQLDGKVAEIELLRSRLESGNESLQDRSDDTAEIENLKSVLQDLKARLIESESLNQEMVARAEKADRLEELNSRLREALRKTGEMLRNKKESTTQNGDESLDITHLQG
jgi:chromosome segregation ATPase